jgi:hypothetical protein
MGYQRHPVAARGGLFNVTMVDGLATTNPSFQAKA